MNAKELQVALNLKHINALRAEKSLDREVFSDLMYYNDSVQDLNRWYAEYNGAPYAVSGDILAEHVNS